MLLCSCPLAPTHPDTGLPSLVADILGPLLRSGEPVQEAAHLHREDHRAVQGQEAHRGPSARFRNHRLRLQVSH